MIINIRGTNGSGKTTLARSLIGADANPVDLVRYSTPTGKERWVEGWGTPQGFLAVGSYKQGCGGLDTVPSFSLQQNAIRVATEWTREDGREMGGLRPLHVVAEGVLASTVYGSWGDFFLAMKAKGHRVLVAYLDTPVEVCLERIRERQRGTARGERPIKEEQVRAKVKAIAATRPRFDAAGIPTIELRHDHAQLDLTNALRRGVI